MADAATESSAPLAIDLDGIAPGTEAPDAESSSASSIASESEDSRALPGDAPGASEPLSVDAIDPSRRGKKAAKAKAPNQPQEPAQEEAPSKSVLEQLFESEFAAPQDDADDLDEDSAPDDEAAPEEATPGKGKSKWQKQRLRLREAEQRAQLFAQRTQELQSQSQQFEQEAVAAYNELAAQNQTLQQQLAKMAGQLEALQRTGQGPQEPDYVGSFKQEVLKGAEEQLSPKLQALEAKLHAWEQEKKQAQEQAEYNATKQRFHQESMKATRQVIFPELQEVPQGLDLIASMAAIGLSQQGKMPMAQAGKLLRRLILEGGVHIDRSKKTSSKPTAPTPVPKGKPAGATHPGVSLDEYLSGETPIMRDLRLGRL